MFWNFADEYVNFRHLRRVHRSVVAGLGPEIVDADIDLDLDIPVGPPGIGAQGVQGPNIGGRGSR